MVNRETVLYNRAVAALKLAMAREAARQGRPFNTVTVVGDLVAELVQIVGERGGFFTYYAMADVVLKDWGLMPV